ncbi:MAG: leucyl/phenylalanyl-tRNA--protein transferase [Pseudomonadota bacterium]
MPQDITPELLLQAYASGIFPMAEREDALEVFWVDPNERGILPLDAFHISRSLRRRIRSGVFQITVNQDFDGVVAGCADRAETWINPTIRDLYSGLFRRGRAHSLEVWHEDKLAGGVYGVSLGAAFFGESMFSRRTDASKVALAYLVDRLKTGGFRLFDAQFLTAHLQSLGAIEISRINYHHLLREAVLAHADFDGAGAIPSPQELLQRMTHTS